jgi:hypothetical protein
VLWPSRCIAKNSSISTSIFRTNVSDFLSLARCVLHSNLRGPLRDVADNIAVLSHRQAIDRDMLHSSSSS